MGIWWDIMGYHEISWGINGDIIITTLVGGLNVFELCFIVRLSWGWWSLFTNNCWKGHGKPTILTLLMYVYIIIYTHFTNIYIYIYTYIILILYFSYIYIYIIETTVNISWFASTMLYNQQWQYVFGAIPMFLEPGLRGQPLGSG